MTEIEKLREEIERLYKEAEMLKQVCEELTTEDNKNPGLLDMFASSAMNGILSSYEGAILDINKKNLARNSYELAREMLKERAK